MSDGKQFLRFEQHIIPSQYSYLQTKCRKHKSIHSALNEYNLTISSYCGLRVPEKTCHASADLASRLRNIYTFSPKT